MLILIDGISGSGKTTLAAELAGLLRAHGMTVSVIHMDLLSHGWTGLAEGSRLAELIATGQVSEYQPWNWETSRRDPPVPVGYDDTDPTQALIIEGCGSITAVTAREADVSIWLEATEELAYHRVKVRENTDDPDWWDTWHKQELEHWERNHPQALATLRLPIDA